MQIYNLLFPKGQICPAKGDRPVEKNLFGKNRISTMKIFFLLKTLLKVLKTLILIPFFPLWTTVQNHFCRKDTACSPKDTPLGNEI